MRDLSIRSFAAPLVVLAIIAMSLVSAAPVAAGAPGETGQITVIKRFCETDNSDNTNSNCNGRDESAEGTSVDFSVTLGGAAVETISVPIANQGNGSQGQASGASDLVAGETYLVCEDVPDGYESVPRPGAQGGNNQTGVSGEPCIEVELDPGNNVLQFDNFPLVTNTPTPEPSATATATTPPDATATATTAPDATATATTAPGATKAPDATATTTTVEVLPVTGANASNGGWTLGLLAAGLAMVLGVAGLSMRRRSS